MWIVSGSEKDKVTLVSSNKIDRILPIGTYLTVTGDDNVRHVLLVERSYQKSLFEPSPLVIDAGLPILKQDQECKNILIAREIRQIPVGSDGMFSFIKPNEKARRTTQQEINEVFAAKGGFPVFLATDFMGQNSVLRDDTGNMIHIKIPFHSLYLQTMICGQTGSGKTVAMKYLIEQFIEHEKGAVLAINVKSIDLLTMDQPTTIEDTELKAQTESEWRSIEVSGNPIRLYHIYEPASPEKCKEGVNSKLVSKITLKTEELEPESLLGVLRNITDRASEALPGVFRHWRATTPKSDLNFRNFINWFKNSASKENDYTIPMITDAGEDTDVKMHVGTIDAILRSLETASSFFDRQEECVAISEKNILVSGKLTVIDLSSKNTPIFGAVLLRHLLSKIYEAKAVKGDFKDLPVLIVIDEVHQFYNTDASEEALGQLNAIARMGRSEKIGVIFASQNPEDLPKGLTSIVNTRIFFRSLETVSRRFDSSAIGVELSSLGNGYASMSTAVMPQVKFVKFPISLMGVKT
jgi:hypothetical protein